MSSSSSTLNFMHTRAFRGALPVRCSDMDFPLHLDPEEQRMLAASHQRRQHEQWMRDHVESGRMNLAASRAKACILVAEAARLERVHLTHQRALAVDLIRRRKQQQANTKRPSSNVSARSAISPARGSNFPSPSRQVQTPTATCRSEDATSYPSSPVSTPIAAAPPSTCCDASSSCLPRCGCLQVPMRRLLTPRCRVIAMLKGRIDGDVEDTVDALRQTYSCDDEMLEDLAERYGPEPEEVDPELLLLSVDERCASLTTRWRRIGDAVEQEMSSTDAFTSVIRTLSVMRIFLEGSQNSEYGIDFGDRQRREAQQQSVLAELRQRGSLFL